MPNPIPLFTLEARIRRALRRHLRNLGFTKTDDGLLSTPCQSKSSFRTLHLSQRNDRLKTEKQFIRRVWPQLKNYFANGTDVTPNQITPRLELIEGGSWQSELFRLTCLTWSVPVSQGYGRRMRFLVWDDNNGKLIGLIGLCDPVFNLKVRDQLIGWNAEDRRNRLVNIMDAYVLGAIPPYSFLLAGKMLACLIRTTEVRDAFLAKYGFSRGIISKRRKNPSLALVTTSSALGKSSLYNRLSLDGTKYFSAVGFTSGWGHFHIPQKLFTLIRVYLQAKDHAYSNNNRFGDGPNWKLRAIRHALSLLDMNPNLLRHGIPREVFICQMASNSKNFLLGKVNHASYNGILSVKQVAQMAINRWVLPRSASRPEYQDWKSENLLDLLVPKDQPNCTKIPKIGKDTKVGSS